MFKTSYLPRLLPMLLLLGFAWPLQPARAQAALKNSVPHITVTGEARKEVVPDVAILYVAAVTERPKADAAAADNAKTAQGLIDELKAHGIDAKDIKTVSVTLYPVYDEQRDPSGRLLKKVLRGYRARNVISVKVHNIAKAGMLTRLLIDKGANELQGIKFDYDHKEMVYNELRGQAMHDALHRAKTYASALGLHLERILEIAPAQPYLAAPRYAMDGGFARKAAPTTIPLEPGTLTFTARVRVVWELSE